MRLYSLPAFILSCCVAWCLLGLAGCSTSPEGVGEQAERGKVEDGRIELPEPEPVPGLASDEWSPPPVWLVSRGRIVQGSYGEFCKLDDCTGMETPEQMGDDLAAIQVSGKETFVVIGSSRVSEFAAGTREWSEESAGPPVPGVYTEPGIPPGMRGLDARRVPEGANPTVEPVSIPAPGETTGPVSSGASDGTSVFDLASNGRPGDRRLSVYLEIGEYDRAVYHWRLDPGSEADIVSPEASPETTSATIEELASPQEKTVEETTSLAADNEPRGPAFRGVRTRSIGGSPTGIAAGEGYLWVLDRDSSGPALLKLNPDTGEKLSTLKVPDTSSGLEAGSGAVWLIEEDMGTVLRLDPSSGKVEQRIRVGGSPSEMAVAEDAVWVAITNGERSGKVVKIDPRTASIAAEIETPGSVESITVDATSGEVWAVVPEAVRGIENRDEAQILRMEPETNSISERLVAPGGVTDIAAGAGAVWAMDPDGELLEIAAEKTRISSVTPLASPGPYEMEFGAGSLWVAGVNTLTRVEPGAAASTRSLKVGPYGAENVALGEKYVWTVGPGDGRSGMLTRITP
ncbi:MAG: hypothetical protein H0X23_04900 [Rubrobacter sp.]|nr:hypothetical protein [Rubrobacter sp.]